MPKVSIVIPVYGVEEYIDKCLKSLVNQTLQDIEIIVVNDGSKDNSQDIIDEYVKRDKRIKSIIKENGGQASARNMGIKLATGDYLGFVDSDDWIESNMYELLYNEAVSNDYDVVFCNYHIETNGIREEADTIVFNPEKAVESYIFSQPAPWNKIFKRHLWVNNKLKFAEGMIYEDYAIIPVFPLYANKFSYVDKCLYNYLVRDGSTMNQAKFNPKFKDIVRASKVLFENLSKVENPYWGEYEYIIFANTIRDNYFKLRIFPEAMPVLVEMIDWFRRNFPNWKKNKYIKKNGWKYMLYSRLIIKKRFKLLNMLKKR